MKQERDWFDLQKWLIDQDEAQFPHSEKSTYLTRLDSIRDSFERNIFPHVEMGALLKGDGYLTDHGKEHIDTVIRRAARLLGPEGISRFSAYEIYLLIAAIYLHDAGNLYGRLDHEKRVAKIVRETGDLMGEDSPEKRIIISIAAAHGGRVNGNKDTISSLHLEPPYILGKPVQVRALAALLRFADELADGRRRAARFPLKLGVIPAKSEIYHVYAARLHSVIPHPAESTIDLKFQITREDACRKFLKSRRRIYLLDEIFSRAIKMHAERIYCMRFMEGIVSIRAIDVEVEVFLSEESPLVARRIPLRLEESGYPEVGEASLRDLCPAVEWTGKKLCEELKHMNGE